MKFNHRVVAQPETSGLKALLTLQYPYSLVIPIVLFIISLYSVWQYFGTGWDTGTFSIVFVPYIGQALAPFLSGDHNLVLSTLVIIMYALGPVVFYAYVLYVTNRHLPAIITALLSMLPLFPFSASPPERLVLALYDRDGAHIIGLTLIPLGAILFQRFLRSGGSLLQWSSIGTAFILGLLSFFAFTILVVFYFFICVSEMLVGQAQIKLIRFLKTVGFLLLLFLVTYNVSLVEMATTDAGHTMFEVLSNIIPLSFFLVPVLATAAFLIFDRRPQLTPLFLSIGFTITFGLMQWVRVSFIDISAINQSRFSGELSFTLAFFIGVLSLILFEALRRGDMLKRTPQLYAFRNQIAVIFIVVLISSLLISILAVPRSI